MSTQSHVASTVKRLPIDTAGLVNAGPWRTSVAPSSVAVYGALSIAAAGGHAQV